MRQDGDALVRGDADAAVHHGAARHAAAPSRSQSAGGGQRSGSAAAAGAAMPGAGGGTAAAAAAAGADSDTSLAAGAAGAAGVGIAVSDGGSMQTRQSVLPAAGGRSETRHGRYGAGTPRRSSTSLLILKPVDPIVSHTWTTEALGASA